MSTATDLVITMTLPLPGHGPVQVRVEGPDAAQQALDLARRWPRLQHPTPAPQNQAPPAAVQWTTDTLLPAVLEQIVNPKYRHVLKLLAAEREPRVLHEVGSQVGLAPRAMGGFVNAVNNAARRLGADRAIVLERRGGGLGGQPIMWRVPSGDTPRDTPTR